jgi:hypothetical protein
MAGRWCLFPYAVFPVAASHCRPCESFVFVLACRSSMGSRTLVMLASRRTFRERVASRWPCWPPCLKGFPLGR